jgi:hypothetical protein
MTNFYGPNNPTEVNDGYPGAAPVPGAGTLMTGNPSGEPSGVTYSLPGNQNCPQQLTATQLSSGNITTNSVPTNVLTAPGTDSLMAQMSRGQVILGDSTYGQSQFAPGNASQQNPVNAATTVPVTARVASTLTYPAAGSAQNYTGN